MDKRWGGRGGFSVEIKVVGRPHEEGRLPISRLHARGQIIFLRREGAQGGFSSRGRENKHGVLSEEAQPLPSQFEKFQYPRSATTKSFSSRPWSIIGLIIYVIEKAG